jgi:hypothetical protein
LVTMDSFNFTGFITTLALAGWLVTGNPKPASKC